MPLSDNGLGGSGLGSKNNSSGTRSFVVCLVLSLAILGVGARMGESSPFVSVRGAFLTVTSPVRYLGSTIAVPFQGLGNIFTNLTADQETLSELRQQVSELRARNSELEEAQATAERLQGLLDLKDNYSLTSTAARIISGSSDSWTQTVTIDKGTSQGITAGMPVVAASGVIGQVIEAGSGTAVVRRLSDENSSISVMVQSSRLQGMLEGSVTGQVKLTLIRSNQKVEVGDIIVTSGLGGVFPKGLPVGRVMSVESNPGSLYLDIVVELFAQDGEGSEEVLVITSLSEDQRASAEDIAEADSQELGNAPTPIEDEKSDEAEGRDVEVNDTQDAQQPSQEG